MQVDFAARFFVIECGRVNHFAQLSRENHERYRHCVFGDLRWSMEEYVSVVRQNSRKRE